MPITTPSHKLLEALNSLTAELRHDLRVVQSDELSLSRTDERKTIEWNALQKRNPLLLREDFLGILDEVAKRQ